MVRRLTRTGLVLVALGLLLRAGAVPAQPAPPPVATGQSATLLSDGRWLLVGGEGAQGPQATIAVWDPRTGTTTALRAALDSPRAGHTATLLPDGTVLIAGGVGVAGGVLDTGVRFDPTTETVDPISVAGLTPRTDHTATVLTDARVLFSGGRSAGGALVTTVEVWDAQTGEVQALPGTLSPGRSHHTATLEPGGTVLLWGGQDAQGVALATGERIDPTGQTFTVVTTAPAPAADPPAVAASRPADGAVDVPLDSRIALGFSTPLQVDSVTPQTVALSGPAGLEPARVVPVEGGRLVFLTPEAPLQAGVQYEVVVTGPVDATGRPVPFTSVQFTTMASGAAAPTGRAPLTEPSAETTPADPASGDAEERGSPEWTASGPGAGRTGWPDSRWRALPALRASSGDTALAGQVLTLRGEPLPGVTLQLGSRQTQSDATGRFLLTGLPAGHEALVIDGRSATRPGRTYGVFEVGVDLVAGETTALSYTIWMPRIDTAHAVSIPSPTTTDTRITTPRIPGLELWLPAGAVVTDHEHRPVRQLTITPIPLDRPPFPLAVGVEPPVYFTIQPGGGYVYASSRRGARLIYPNRLRWAPGEYARFWHYSPEGPGWYIYGEGRVTPDGRRVVPNPGVELYEFTGAMAEVDREEPACEGCPPEPPDPPKTPRDPHPDPGPEPKTPTGGDPVELTTGHFVLRKTDLVLPDVIPLALTRMYRSGETAVRGFGRGMMPPYDLWLRSPDAQNPYQTLDLTLADSATVRYLRTSPGTGFVDAVLEHKTTPTAWHGSKIVWNGAGWDLTRRDGMVYVFGENAPLTEIRDRFGNRVTITRVGPTFPPTRITSPNGRWLEFTLSGALITQARDNLGRVMTYEYDAQGRLWKVTDPAGGVTEYGYDAAHTLTTIRDARGIVYLKNEYTGARVTRQVLADGTKDALDPTNTRASQFAYTINGAWSTQVDVTDPRGFVRRVTNQPGGYVLTDTQALGQPEARTTTYTRDPATSLVTARVDQLNRRTEYTYSPKGDLLTITRLAGTPQAFTTTFTYEDNATQPLISQLKTMTLPSKPPTTFTYTAQGALTQITDPLGHTVTITPNAQGQPTAVSTHSTPTQTETTQFGYDALGDLVTITDPLTRTTTRFLDDGGRLVSVTDPAGRRTRYEHDTLNRLTKVIDPLGGTTQFQYDLNGNLRFVTDARAKTTEYTYDNADRVATRKDPLQRTESYQYDGTDNLTQVTDRKGQVGTFTYDALHRRTLASFAPAGPVTSRAYDAGHRLVTVSDSVGGTITRSYDGLDRLTQEITPKGTVTSTYDAAGRRATMTVAGQSQVVYTHDHADRLTQLTRGSNTYTFGYDDANRRTLVTLPNGIRIESGYDAASQLSTVDYRQGPGGPLLGNLTYTSDLAGQRTKVGGTWARTGLPAAVASAVYDDANQLTNWGGTPLTYDNNGNLTNDGTKTYTWNARNQLTAVTGATFEYDGLGRRQQRVVGSTTRAFVYDGLNPVQEKQGNQVKANLVTGLGLDEYLTRIEGNTTRHLLPDALGSTLALTDTSGTVQTEYTYEPFGKTATTGQSSTNPFQYTGREDDGTGLYYYRARYYHPGLHRFVSEDPIGFHAGVNFYAYVGNDPLRYTDPLGLDKRAPDDWPPIVLADVIPFPPGPRERPYWLPPPIPGQPADVIPFRRRQPTPTPLIIPPSVEPFPLVIPNVPLFQKYLDSLTGRPPGT